jgi:ELWxxDGT repeat protein
LRSRSSSTATDLNDHGGRRVRLAQAVAFVVVAMAVSVSAPVDASGARLVKDLAKGRASSIPAPGGDGSPMAEIGGVLYFAAASRVSGEEPYTTRGTARTTRMLRDIHANSSTKPWLSGSDPRSFIEVDGKVLFAASEAVKGTSGRELWSTDGTTEGTRRLLDLYPGDCEPTFPCSSAPGQMVRYGGRLWFAATDGRRGRELWVSDGTSGGTERFMDIHPGAGSSFPVNLFAAAGLLWFVANDGIHGRELWRTDGTHEGTHILDIRGGPRASEPRELTRSSGSLVFFANDGDRGWGLWRSDGTAGGTDMVTPVSAPGRIATLADLLLFSADGRLWRSDGTHQGTAPIRSFDGFGELVSGPRDRVFFVADDGVHGQELWRSDGTGAGTVLIKDTVPGREGSSPEGLTALGNAVFFAATARGGRELWMSKGTRRKTRRVADIRPRARSSEPLLLLPVGRTLYFWANDGAHGHEPWVWEP